MNGNPLAKGLLIAGIGGGAVWLLLPHIMPILTKILLALAVVGFIWLLARYGRKQREHRKHH